MPILDSIKDPATGQIKKPILFSMIGGGGLVAYLLFKGKATAGVSQTGQPALDLSGLASALNDLAGGGGLAGSGGSDSSGGGRSISPPSVIRTPLIAATGIAPKATNALTPATKALAPT